MCVCVCAGMCESAELMGMLWPHTNPRNVTQVKFHPRSLFTARLGMLLLTDSLVALHKGMLCPEIFPYQDKHLAKKRSEKNFQADIIKVGNILINLSCAAKWRFLLLCKWLLCTSLTGCSGDESFKLTSSLHILLRSYLRISLSTSANGWHV